MIQINKRRQIHMTNTETTMKLNHYAYSIQYIRVPKKVRSWKHFYRVNRSIDNVQARDLNALGWYDTEYYRNHSEDD